MFEQINSYERHYQTNGLQIHAVAWENANSNPSRFFCNTAAQSFLRQSA